MKQKVTRRGFLQASAVVSVPAIAGAVSPGIIPSRIHVPSRRRVIAPASVGSRNALAGLKIATDLMAGGTPPVDASVAGINPVEDDPNDTSVGYGGLPNERCVVELDSCVMDGPTGLAGAVASLRNIKNPSKVALKVMRRTDHVLLVGVGALEFAKAHGFQETELLTDRARRAWLRWKENLSTKDDWVSPREGAKGNVPRPTGTIHISSINENADLGACTSTSGLAYKVPGRVGDSPLIGCGLYTDNDYGSAGSTGRGEAVIISNGAAFVVQQMAMGKTPTDACLAACKRIDRLTRAKRLQTPAGRPDFQVNFYAVNKKGETGGASIYPSRFAAFDENGHATRRSACLYETKK